MTILTEPRCVVVGYGSIGSRHTRILQELGCRVAVVSRRALEDLVVYSSLAEAVRHHKPEYVVIASETALHHDALLQLAVEGYQGAVLVEKPLFESTRATPAHRFRRLNVAYNLRFHPVIARLKTLLADQQILSVHGYVGQYLPDWRPGTDYKNSYSAKEDMGGGVLLDLSHDLDYLVWMFGDWVQVAALGGHLSSLEITSDDSFTLLMSLSRCRVAAIQLNYLDRRGRRRLIVNTANHTYEADLIRNTLVTDRTEETFTVERDDTYRAMHVAMLRGTDDASCSIDEALSIMRLIDASRRSNQKREWVTQ